MKKVKVAYQGIKGAYSEQAIIEFFNKKKLNFEGVSKRNFRELFEAIKRETYLGIVPIENSNAGSVVENYDLLLEYDVEILAEYNLKVEHCLLAKKRVNLKDIKEVYSHPQALMQCSKFIEKNNIIPISYLDTAGSSKFVSKNKREDLASISSEVAAKHYNLNVLKKEIQNDKNNVTRFLLVKKRTKKFVFEKNFKIKDKSTIIIETRNIPGALYKCLGAFATNNINLTKLESRPSKAKNFEYIFYMDFEGNLNDRKVKLALDEINFFAEKVKILGSYKSSE